MRVLASYPAVWLEHTVVDRFTGFTPGLAEFRRRLGWQVPLAGLVGFGFGQIGPYRLVDRKAWLPDPGHATSEQIAADEARRKWVPPAPVAFLASRPWYSWQAPGTGYSDAFQGRSPSSRAFSLEPGGPILEPVAARVRSGV
jgi:hypothetical protein